MDINFWINLPIKTELKIKFDNEITELIYSHIAMTNDLYTDGTVYCIEKDGLVQQSIDFHENIPERYQEECEIEILYIKKTENERLVYIPIKDKYLPVLQKDHSEYDIQYDYFDQGWNNSILDDADDDIFKLDGEGYLEIFVGEGLWINERDIVKLDIALSK